MIPGLFPQSVNDVLKKYGFASKEGQVRGVHVSFVNFLGSRSQTLRVIARLAHELDLGLYVHQSQNSFGSSSTVTVSDPEFMGIFAVSCGNDEEAAVKLLLTSSVRRELLALARAGYAILTDDGACCQIEPSLMTAQEISIVVEACVNIALEMDTLSKALEPPAMLRAGGVADALMAAALAREFVVQKHPFVLNATSAVSDVSLSFQTHFTNRFFGSAELLTALPGYRVSVRFHQALGLGLRLRSASLFDRAQSMFGFKDLQVGDAKFDSRWTIAARDEDKTRAIFHADARLALDTLADLGIELSLDDTGLSGFGSLPKKTSDAPVLIETLTTLYDTLQPRVASGPYR